jgi:microcystin degradation protein MlrC
MKRARVITGAVVHESNTFSSSPTGLDKFREGKLFEGAAVLDALRGTESEVGGFLAAAEEEAFELIPTVYGWATPSGPVTREAIEHLEKQLVNGIRAALKNGPVAGALLALHGAMVTERSEDGEGEILAAVRQLLGARTPIIATLDFHANITPLMAQLADALIVYDTYPHVDLFERGREAGRLMARIIRKEVRPTMALRQVNMFTCPPKQITDRPPMKLLLDEVFRLEKQPGILTASLAGGFQEADIYDAGLSCVVVSDADRELAARAAGGVGELAWQMRENFRPELVPVNAAVQAAMAAPKGPVVLADMGDNPGGGGANDGTVLLRALLEAGARQAAVGSIADRETVARCAAAGVGAIVKLTLGGKTDRLHGDPLAVSGRVQAITDGRFVCTGPMFRGQMQELGRTAVVECFGRDGGSVTVLVTERRLQLFGPDGFRHAGIEPLQQQIVVVKSLVHFRSGFEPIAARIIEVDTPGVSNPRVETRTYRKVRRPMFPLDDAPGAHN